MWKYLKKYISIGWGAISTFDTALSVLGWLGVSFAAALAGFAAWLSNQTTIIIFVVAFATFVLLALLVMVFYGWRKERISTEGSPDSEEGLAGYSAALSRYDSTVTDLGDRSIIIARLVEQYRRLSDASIDNTARSERNVDYEELFHISELIFSQVSRFVPPLPSEPRNGFIIALGWNHFLVIFDVPTRISPKVTVTNLPDGAHSEITNITNISFEVKFWPETVKVESFGYEADARL